MNATLTEQLFFFIAGAFTAIELMGVTTGNLTAALTGASGFAACAAIGTVVVIRHLLRQRTEDEATQ